MTDYLAAKLCQAAIQDDWKPEKIFASIIDPVLETLLTGVPRDASANGAARHIENAFLTGHVLCALCVIILKLDEAAEEEVDRLRDEAVEALVGVLFGPEEEGRVSALARIVLRRAFAAGVNGALAAMEEVTHHGTAIRMVRLLGVITCPDIETHPQDEVSAYCVMPLAKALLSTWLVQWIMMRSQERVTVKLGA